MTSTAQNTFIEEESYIENTASSSSSKHAYVAQAAAAKISQLVGNADVNYLEFSRDLSKQQMKSVSQNPLSDASNKMSTRSGLSKAPSLKR